jgi:type I restriction enzyme S subunit
LIREIKEFNETGTVFGSISKNDFESIEISLPDFEKIANFQGIVSPFDDKIALNTNQINRLSRIRDTLLPKLMSGEVRVNTN